MQAQPLSAICTLITDGTHYTPPDIGAGIPFLTVKDIDWNGAIDLHASSKISEDEYRKAALGNCAPVKGDVLFSKDGTVGKVSVVRTHTPFAVLSSVAILRPDIKSVDPEYLAHALRSPDAIDQALRKKTGSAIRRIILSDLKNVRIPLPRLEEQRRIAAILDKADALRAKRREAIAKLDQLLQSVFLDMFGDTAAETNEVCRPIESVLERIIDYRGKTPEKTGHGVPLITAKLVKEMRVTEPTEFIAEESYVPWMTRGIPRPGSVLITTEAPMGQVAQVPEYRAALAQRLLALEVNNQQLDATFLMWALSMPSTQDQLRKYSTGSTVTGIRQKEFRKVLVPVPTLDAQRHFAGIASSIQREKIRQESAMTKSNSLFLALQNVAFSESLTA